MDVVHLAREPAVEPIAQKSQSRVGRSRSDATEIELVQRSLPLHVGRGHSIRMDLRSHKIDYRLLSRRWTRWTAWSYV